MNEYSLRINKLIEDDESKQEDRTWKRMKGLLINPAEDILARMAREMVS